MQNSEVSIDNRRNSGDTAKNTARIHGGNIYQAAKHYGLDCDKIIDFSSNVNPLGPSSQAKRAAKKALSLVGRYPDPDMAELRRAIAGYFGIKPEQVICGNGSNALLHLIPRVFRPRKVLVPVPTFSEYAAAAEAAGSEVVTFPLKERDGFRMDPVEMAFALKDVDMVFLCNPNNPTGQIIVKAEMLEIMKYALDHGVTLVVDEAFMDFIESESIIKETVHTSHIICLRDFAAFFGMPGFRVGYAVSDEATIALLREGQEPWSVNIPAGHAVAAALEDWTYIKKTRSLIARERERLLSALRLLPGVETFPCSANFILFKLTSMDAYTLMEKLGVQGMLLRDCSSFPGLGEGYIRISVRTRRENNRLIKTLRKLLIK
ncbi:MAG: threonine-phosphate decarboxylase CobD [Nitrospiraceae bacterium]|nr:threonine-phosphate decarboxylase CobD [Nitrospiraceae bacterium]